MSNEDYEGRETLRRQLYSMPGMREKLGLDKKQLKANGGSDDAAAYTLPTVEVPREEDESSAPQDFDWGEPQALGGELPPVAPFKLEMLPLAMRPLANDTAERMQVPLDFPAITSVLALAGTVGRRVRMYPKHHDHEWGVVPNLWGVTIAPPGWLKSPVIIAITRPLAHLEKLWRCEYQAELTDYEFEKEKADLELTAWKQLYTAARKNPEKEEPVRPDNSIAKPVLKRLIVHDASPEKLHEILSENPSGVLLVRDELAGLLARLDEEGHGGERQFYLMSWNGDAPYSVDRIGRGSIYGEACCISLLGAMTPSKLRSYIADALQDGPQNDGLFQRLQLAIWPDQLKEWNYIDREPLAEAINQAEQLYRRIISLDAEQPRLYHFEPRAQELFIDWYACLQQKLRDPELHPALISHLSKYASLPSLGVLFELADDEAMESELVSYEHANQAVSLCDYLESHARRIYSMVVTPARAAACELGRHLIAGWKPKGRFTAREVYFNGWRGLDTPEKVRPALEILADARWILPFEGKKSVGRPSEVYLINPKLKRRTAP